MVSEEKMFENVDKRMDPGVTGILLAHPWAFGSGELKMTGTSCTGDARVKVPSF